MKLINFLYLPHINIRKIDAQFFHINDTTVLALIFPNYSELPIIAEPGHDIDIEGDASHLKATTVNGSESNELMTAFRLKVNDMMPPDVVKEAGKGAWKGQLVTDWYGRPAPKPAHGSLNLGKHTSSTRLITKAVADLFDGNVDKRLHVRRINVSANHVIDERRAAGEPSLDLFGEKAADDRERKQQEAILEIRRRFGKNAILKGMDFEEGATARERNKQIGGHKA